MKKLMMTSLLAFTVMGIATAAQQQKTLAQKAEDLRPKSEEIFMDAVEACESLTCFDYERRSIKGSNYKGPLAYAGTYYGKSTDERFAALLKARAQLIDLDIQVQDLKQQAEQTKDGKIVWAVLCQGSYTTVKKDLVVDFVERVIKHRPSLAYFKQADKKEEKAQ